MSRKHYKSVYKERDVRTLLNISYLFHNAYGCARLRAGLFLLTEEAAVQPFNIISKLPRIINFSFEREIATLRSCNVPKRQEQMRSYIFKKILVMNWAMMKSPQLRIGCPTYLKIRHNSVRLAAKLMTRILFYDLTDRGKATTINSQNSLSPSIVKQ